MPNVNELCMHCLNPLPAHQTRCELCGHTISEQNGPQYLRVRTELSERYVVGLLLSAGGDSAIYAGYDTVAKAPCEIREYMPDTLCEREASGTLTVISGCENAFEEYKEAFRVHARALAHMRDVAAVIPTYDIFEENNTVYTVTEKVSGVSLESHLAISGGKLGWEEARPLFVPLLSAFMQLHKAGMRHYGISPETLIVAADGKLHIRGFLLPESRTVGSDLKPQLLPGYSAPEQYGFNQHCDTATDVYALTAILFRMLTGNPPPDGMTRKSTSDLFVPTDVAQALPDYVKKALFKGLQVSFDKRLQTVEALRDILSATPAVAELRKDEEADDQPEETEEPVRSSKKTVWLITIGVFVVLLAAAVLGVFLLFGGDEGDETTQTTNSKPSFATTTTTDADPTKYYVVDQVVGKNYFQIQDEFRTGEMTLELTSLQFNNAPRGTILSQTPEAGTQKEAGTVIKVIISAGSQELTVPNVAGWEEAHARAYLEALGFTVKPESILLNVSNYEMGLVDSVDPAVGTKLPYGSVIQLRVSNMITTTTTTTTTQPPTSATTEAEIPPEESGDTGAEEDDSGGFWPW